MLTKGQMDKAYNIFKAIVETPENANNIPALLGKVININVLSLMIMIIY